MAVYMGFWAFQNVIRPARFAASVAITPAFDKLVDMVQDKVLKLGGNRLEPSRVQVPPHVLLRAYVHGFTQGTLQRKCPGFWLWLWL